MLKIVPSKEKCFYCGRDTSVKTISMTNDDGKNRSICLCKDCITWAVNDLYKDNNFNLEIR